MIVQIEDYFGDTIGAVMVTENDIETGELKVLKTTGDISIADIDFDDIFDTNEEKVRIQIAKIKWNLENDCGIKNIDECFNKGELP